MEAVFETLQTVERELKINSISPNFSYVNHLGVIVKNIKTATL